MRHAAILVLVGLAILAPAETATAQTGRWLGRVRGLGVLTDDTGDTIGNTGTRLGAGNAFAGELGVTYFVKPHLGLELSATSTRLDLTSVGGQFPGLDAGKVTVTAALLSFEYHFATATRLRPYLGVGAAFAHVAGSTITPDLLQAGIGSLTFSDSLRVYTQAGADFTLGNGWRLGLDVRYAPTTTRVDLYSPAGAPIASVALNLNPVLIGIGIGRLF